MAAQQRHFQIANLQLAALEWPGEGLPVLALHGWLDNAASFVPLAEQLAGHHLLAVDLPGHGHSDHLPAEAHYHLADNLYWIRAMADAMGWSRFALLGHSMGAAIASLTAAAMPQRVLGLTLIDGMGPLAFSPQQEVERLQQLFSLNQIGSSQRSFEDLATAVRIRRQYSRFAISREAASLLVERNLCEIDGGLKWRYDERLKQPSSHYYCEEQVLGILNTIEVPSMLISGEQGALAGWDGFAKRRAAFSNLQHASLEGGHHLHMESPKAVAQLLRPFYASLMSDVR